MKSALMLTAVLLAAASRAVVCQTITVAGNPAALTVTNAIAGSQPTAVSAPAVNYTITTPNPAGRTYKITAQLTSAMPAGVTLTATMTAPGGATSAGAVTLSTTPSDMVTGIPRNTSFTGTITYQVSANVSAGVVSATSRSVTLTIVQFP